MTSLDILIVDDDRDIADSLSFIVERRGHKATLAYDGETAVDLCAKQDFDVSFIDIMLPGIDGVECFLNIQKNKPDCQAYMMTGFSAKDLIEKALDNGALGVLYKPVMPEEILGKLDSTGRGTVLVADDDPEFAKSIALLVQTAGWRTKNAKTGREAVDMVQHGGVDALVLDLKMPEMDGIEVCSELERLRIRLPIIVVTGFLADYEHLDQLQIHGVLRKPVDPRTVLAHIEESVRKSRIVEETVSSSVA